MIEQLAASGSFLCGLIEAIPGAVYAKDRAGRILFGNLGFAEAVGCSSGNFLGKDDLDLISDADLARAIMANDQRIMTEATVAQMEEKLPGPAGGTTYWLSAKAPLIGGSGRIEGLMGMSINITDRKRRRERERFLAREIEHRSKNLLSVAQNVVRFTSAASTEEFREAVVGRLEALNRAHRVFRRDRHGHLTLRDLLLAELAAYDPGDGGRVRLDGPPVSIEAETVQPLAMTFHELATNAAKYGAFADASGTLDVWWQMPQQSQLLEIGWKETRTSILAAPDRLGFGSRLIRWMVERQLRGTLSIAWEPTGVRYMLAFPTKDAAPA